MRNQNSAVSAHKNTDCALREYIAASVGSPLTEAIQSACLSHSRAQSAGDKVAIAQRTCRVQATEATRAGRFVDAAEWNDFVVSIGRFTHV